MIKRGFGNAGITSIINAGNRVFEWGCSSHVFLQGGGCRSGIGNSRSFETCQSAGKRGLLLERGRCSTGLGMGDFSRFPGLFSALFGELVELLGSCSILTLGLSRVDVR